MFISLISNIAQALCRSGKSLLYATLFIVAGSFPFLVSHTVLASVLFQQTDASVLRNWDYIGWYNNPAFTVTDAPVSIYSIEVYAGVVPVDSDSYVVVSIRNGSSEYCDFRYPAALSETPSYLVLTQLGGSACTLTINQSYDLRVSRYSISDDVDYYSNSAGVAYFRAFDEDGYVPFDGLTQFISITPSYASTTATSTSVGAHVYLNPSDYEDGTYLHMRLVNNTIQNGIGGSVLDAWNASFGGIDIPLVAGDNNVATSTIFGVQGQVNWTLQIVVPRPISWTFGLFDNDEVLVATSSIFYVIQPTALDIAMASTSPGALISSLVSGTTTVNYLDNCKITDFDLSKCLVSIVLPDQTTIEDDFNRLRLLPPWGYAFRFYDILKQTSSSSLPVFTATIPSGIPGSGSTISLDLNGVLDPILNRTGGVFSSPEASSTEILYELTAPYWNTLVYILLGFYILSRVIGVYFTPIHEDEYDVISAPEITKGGRKTGITHKTVIRRRK